MTTITTPDGTQLARNADGAYVPLANIREIDKLRDDLVTELVSLLTSRVQIIRCALQRGFVRAKLALHTIECGFGVVELHLPRLGALIVLPKRRSRVLQRGL